MTIERMSTQRRYNEHAEREVKRLVLGKRIGSPRSSIGESVGARPRSRARDRGMALPSALLLVSMMLTTSALWLEASMALSRFNANVHEHLRATQAADGALVLCTRDWRAGIAPVLAARHGAPAYWTQGRAFEHGAAYEPVSSWPGSARAPQCLIEAAALENPADRQAYWITARGFGALESTQSWLQLMIVQEAGRERQAWRRIVSPPAVN
jgi:Tfp pilus assembly protein PilX